MRARRLVEPGVEVLEEPTGDAAEHVELVDGAEQERLVQHRGQQRVGHAVAGHVHERDAGLAAAPLEVRDHVGPALLARERDARVEIEALLEVT